MARVRRHKKKKGEWTIPKDVKGAPDKGSDSGWERGPDWHHPTALLAANEPAGPQGHPPCIYDPL